MVSEREACTQSSAGSKQGDGHSDVSFYACCAWADNRSFVNIDFVEQRPCHRYIHSKKSRIRGIDAIA